MLLPLLMTTIAGLSTGLGGLIAALFRPTPRLMAFCGGFAGAVMLTVSLADLAPALLDFYGALLSPFGCGAAAAALLLGGYTGRPFWLPHPGLCHAGCAGNGGSPAVA